MQPENAPGQPARIKVTVTDLGTGDSESAEIAEITDDYILTCAGSCHLAHVASYANGTRVLTIKGRRSSLCGVTPSTLTFSPWCPVPLKLSAPLPGWSC